MALLIGTIKRTFPHKGYGFIKDPTGGEDVYFKFDRSRAFEDGRLREWRAEEKRPVPERGKPVRFCMRKVDGRSQVVEFAVVD